MGSKPYWYFFDYQPSIEDALQALRQREFQSGRYYPVMNLFFPIYPINEDSPAPGAKHSSIALAIEDSFEQGTCSILDIERVSDIPATCATSPLSSDELISIFGTEKPTHEMVEAILIEEGQLDIWEETGFDIYENFWETIYRGHCRHLIVYSEEIPSEIFFVGYSFD